MRALVYFILALLAVLSAVYIWAETIDLLAVMFLSHWTEVFFGGVIVAGILMLRSRRI